MEPKKHNKLLHKTELHKNILKTLREKCKVSIKSDRVISDKKEIMKQPRNDLNKYSALRMWKDLLEGKYTHLCRHVQKQYSKRERK